MPYLGSEEIQELYIDGEITINEIAKGLAKGDISRDTFGELMSNSEVGEYLKDGEISSETILDSYLIGKLSVEDLKQIGIDNLILKIWENIASQKEKEYNTLKNWRVNIK